MAQAHERSDAGAKVSVACKLPAGIVMRGFKKGTEREAVVGGGTREYDVYRPTGDSVDIFGTAVPHGQYPKCQHLFGYAITPNVPKDLFDNWMEANRDSLMVKNKLIFAHENAGMLQGATRENESRISGFEMIDPEDPGKKVKGIAKAQRA